MDEIEKAINVLLTHGIEPSLLLVGENQQEVLRDCMNKKFTVLMGDEDDLTARIAWNGYVITVVSSAEEDLIKVYGNKLIA